RSAWSPDRLRRGLWCGLVLQAERVRLIPEGWRCRREVAPRAGRGERERGVEIDRRPLIGPRPRRVLGLGGGLQSRRDIARRAGLRPGPRGRRVGSLRLLAHRARLIWARLIW